MENKYKMAKYYLYNYKNIEKLIEERREEIIDGVCCNLNNCLRGINTIETQVIALIEDKRIKMLKRWQVQIRNVLAFLRKKRPLYYKVIVMKYINQMSEKDIQKALGLNLKQIRYIDNKVVTLLIKKVESEV